MSNQYDGRPSPTQLNSGFSSHGRQQTGPSRLMTTIIDRAHGPLSNLSTQEPHAGTPLSPMFSPSRPHFDESAYTSSRTYNPGQWSHPGYAESSRAGSGASASRGSTRDATGMETSMPSPPPPYTPPAGNDATRPQRASTFGNEVHVSSPLANSFTTTHPSNPRSSPQLQTRAEFPPPPSTSIRNDRDSSRSRFRFQTLTAMVKRPETHESPSQPSSPMMPTTDYNPRPPAGRRAISAGAISLPRSSVSGGDNQPFNRVSPDSGRWEPGMPLPPPPPGPPPAISVRSHSLNRFGQQPSTEFPDTQSVARSTAPYRTSNTGVLPTVPPTPAGWVEDDPIPDSMVRAEVAPIAAQPDPAPQQPISLIRRPARRDPSADSILERRSKSRAGKDISTDTESGSSGVRRSPAIEGPAFRKPKNLVLSSADPLLERRLAEREERSSPQSGGRSKAPLSITALTPPYTPSPDLQRRQAKAVTSGIAHQDVTTPGSDAFAQASLERFHMFIQQEASSPTDRIRLELFANFMVQESRIRRDRYNHAFGSMAGEIMELTRDMWRSTIGHSSPKQRQSLDELVHEVSRMAASPGSAHNSAAMGDSSCSSATELTPATDTDSLYDADERPESRAPPASWGERFQPSLSPIRSVPSMAMSTVVGEEGSRGRSASRWWEGSGEGSVGNGGRKLEMTKQESKYMSLHPDELILAAQPSPSQGTPTPGTNDKSFGYAPEEYPPEKTNLGEGSPATLARLDHVDMTPSRVLHAPGKQSLIPSLDVSRLVTLPPPYPRHYPALQNNHPSLSNLRAKHREIAEIIKMRQSSPQVEHAWQHTAYTEVVESCEASIRELVRQLDESWNTQQGVVVAQIEGDERPELLEQLTLLKWLFEAREQLRRQEYDQATQEMRRRSQVYIEQCRAAGEHRRQAEEEGRLGYHLQQAQLYFARHAKQRFDQLLEIVDQHVGRGVEIQLSAFWDIAPALGEVVQKIPAQDNYSLATLRIAIPPEEFVDNPGYQHYPLQYLMQTLTHAKKSAYQFIENQTNLLCLLHEVRTAAIAAETKFSEIGRVVNGERVDVVKAELTEVRRRREEHETGVLQERVACLEDQWDSALGKDITAVMGKAKAVLQEQGGWEDIDV
ncbi:hypothetical protein AAFC00_004963 [Neodothiora populina]|uniref:Uncharacterized protein n=1 Tax=Neodothiora populina TaxID=2781224 RepID=A0ABR3P3R7_9PEZI